MGPPDPNGLVDSGIDRPSLTCVFVIALYDTQVWPLLVWSSLHYHAWVRHSSSRLVGAYLATLNPVKFGKITAVHAAVTCHQASSFHRGVNANVGDRSLASFV